MNQAAPPCRTINVFAFRGDHSRVFASAFQRALSAEKNGLGPGPSAEACLLFTGHVGVSIDGGSTIYGFSPDYSGIGVSDLMDGLKNGDAFPGVVRNDTIVFDAARKHGLILQGFEVFLPDSRFQDFIGALDAERRNSQYSYGFPNGDGDCNCITWLERLGLPLLLGRMNEFLGLAGFSHSPSRRFGRCV